MFLLVLISYVLSSCINSRINSCYIVKLPVCKVCQWQRSTERHRPKREELTYKQQGDLTSGLFYHTFTMSINPSGYEPPRNLPLPPRRLKHAKSANPILSSKLFYSAHRDHPHAPLQQQSPMLYTPDITPFINVTLTCSDSHTPPIWDLMLKKFASAKYQGREAADYCPYYALAPCNQEPLDYPTWRLGKFRGAFPAQLAKLAMGSAICLQDVSQREHPLYPNLPTIFGILVRPIWHEREHIIYEVDTHLYSQTLIPAPITTSATRVAIPDCLVIDTDHIPHSANNPGRGVGQFGQSCWGVKREEEKEIDIKVVEIAKWQRDVEQD